MPGSLCGITCLTSEVSFLNATPDALCTYKQEYIVNSDVTIIESDLY